jgi:hypothetical protein
VKYNPRVKAFLLRLCKQRLRVFRRDIWLTKQRRVMFGSPENDFIPFKLNLFSEITNKHKIFINQAITAQPEGGP